ncbi:TPA: hypothetical protein DEW05_00790 [Candidatus Saccharibacteria bacterium]|nr:hypothetical protein [Candidatus Saccharibacteria bacterium]
MVYYRYMKKHKHSGFTIVELLIVIVVIGILAAITIVAFNGIQTRSKAGSVESLLATVEKKAKLYQSINSQLPTAEQFYYNQAIGSTTTNSGPAEARLDGVTIAALNSGSPNPQIGSTPNTNDGTRNVRYVYQTTTCAWLDYWDYNNNRITTLGTTPSSKRIGC